MRFLAIGIAVGAAIRVLAQAAERGPPPAALRRERGNDAARRFYVANLWPKCDVRHSGRRNAMH
jgi:hypothetical protein